MNVEHGDNQGTFDSPYHVEKCLKCDTSYTNRVEFVQHQLLHIERSYPVVSLDKKEVENYLKTFANLEVQENKMSDEGSGEANQAEEVEQKPNINKLAAVGSPPSNKAAPDIDSPMSPDGSRDEDRMSICSLAGGSPSSSKPSIVDSSAENRKEAGDGDMLEINGQPPSVPEKEQSDSESNEKRDIKSPVKPTTPSLPNIAISLRKSEDLMAQTNYNLIQKRLQELYEKFQTKADFSAPSTSQSSEHYDKSDFVQLYKTLTILESVSRETSNLSSEGERRRMKVDTEPKHVVKDGASANSKPLDLKYPKRKSEELLQPTLDKPKSKTVQHSLSSHSPPLIADWVQSRCKPNRQDPTQLKPQDSPVLGSLQDIDVLVERQNVNDNSRPVNLSKPKKPFIELKPILTDRGGKVGWGSSRGEQSKVRGASLKILRPILTDTVQLHSRNSKDTYESLFPSRGKGRRGGISGRPNTESKLIQQVGAIGDHAEQQSLLPTQGKGSKSKSKKKTMPSDLTLMSPLNVSIHQTFTTPNNLTSEKNIPHNRDTPHKELDSSNFENEEYEDIEISSVSNSDLSIHKSSTQAAQPGASTSKKPKAQKKKCVPVAKNQVVEEQWADSTSKSRATSSNHAFPSEFVDSPPKPLVPVALLDSGNMTPGKSYTTLQALENPHCDSSNSSEKTTISTFPHQEDLLGPANGGYPGSQKDLYRCPLCPQRFATSGELEAHSLAEGHIICTMSDACAALNFDSPASLAHHQAMVHQVPQQTSAVQRLAAQVDRLPQPYQQYTSQSYGGPPQTYNLPPPSTPYNGPKLGSQVMLTPMQSSQSHPTPPSPSSIPNLPAGIQVTKRSAAPTIDSSPNKLSRNDDNIPNIRLPDSITLVKSLPAPPPPSNNVANLLATRGITMVASGSRQASSPQSGASLSAVSSQPKRLPNVPSAISIVPSRTQNQQQRFAVPPAPQQRRNVTNLGTVDLTKDDLNGTTRMRQRSPLMANALQRRFSCTICDKVYPSNESLQAHMAVHGQKGRYMCEICRVVYTNEAKLQQHKKTVHAKQPEAEMVIPICDVNQPGVKEKLLQCGIRHVVQLSSLRNANDTAAFGLPIIPVDLARNEAFSRLDDMGASNILSLGTLRTIYR